MPTITVVTEAFVGLANAIAGTLHRDNLPLVVIPHPFGGLSEAAVRARAREIAEALPAAVAAWRPPVARASTDVEVRRPDTLEVEGDDDAAVSVALARLRLTDGLPIVPPTAARVDAALAFAGRGRDAILGPIPPSGNMLTVSGAAANAVMAGCAPEYFPLVMQAVEGMLGKPDVNLAGIQTTTHPLSPMIMFSGPIADQVGVAHGVGCLGPGWRANATIGRAVHLILQNAGEAWPGELDRATMGQPGKFTFCFAENEDDSPWEPYRVEKGFGADMTTVTMVGAEAPHNINDHGSTTAEGILRTIAGTMATAGNNNFYWLGDTFLILGPEHAQSLADEGLSKLNVKQELHKRARVPVSSMSEGQFAHLQSWIAESEQSKFVDSQGRVPLVREPEDIHIVVAGGPGKHSMWVPTWFRSVTKVLRGSDGEAATSLDDFQRPATK